MGLFNLTDIVFNSNAKERKGPAAPLTSSPYSYNIFKYPIDLGNYDKGHYLLININEQSRTMYKGTVTGDNPAVIANRQNLKTPSITDGIGAASSLMGKVLSYVPGSSTVSQSELGQAASDVMDNLKSLKGVRTIRRITDTVAIYMPDTLNFSYNQQYSDLSLKGTLSTGAGALKSIADTFQGNKSIVEGLKGVVPFIASQYLQSSDVGRFLFAAGAGVVQNPQLELLYSSPAFRTFRFEFLMYPRDEQEAKEVQNLIARLRFHQAPEILTGSAGVFLTPPSEFDIKFMYNGKENPNIPKVSTCVLESIDIDYAPNGFSTYEVPGQNTPTLGGTGTPVGVRMSLQFKETEILTKANFASEANRAQASNLSPETAENLKGYQNSVYGETDGNGQGIY